MRSHHFFTFLCVLCAACVSTPRGFDDERARADEAGRAWQAPFEERVLPPLSARPTLDELVRRALLARGDVEAHWHRWRAALAAVEVEGAWPASSFEVEVERAFQGGRSGFDQTSVTLGFEPLAGLPSRSELRSDVAFARARAAGEVLRAAAFDLRADVIESAAELVSARASARALDDDARLLELQARSAEQRLSAGGEIGLVTSVQLEARLARDRSARATARSEQAHARLKALVMLAPEVELDLDLESFGDTPLPQDDTRLFAVAALRDPQVMRSAHEIDARASTVELARNARRPYLSPRLGFQGSVEQFVGASLVLPFQSSALRAGIENARAELAAARADARALAADRAALLATLLSLARDAQRARAWIEDEVLPLTEHASASARAAYVANDGEQGAWLESERAGVQARLALFEARAARAIAIARIEAVVGFELAQLDAQEIAHE